MKKQMTFLEFRRAYTMVSGIYKITNKITGRAIIGSSTKMGERVLQGYVDLSRVGKCHNKPFQEDFDKYGEDSFYCEALEECEEKYLIDREYYYISILDNLYNLKNRNRPIILRQEDVIKFMSLIKIVESGCWEFQAHQNARGYCTMCVNEFFRKNGKIRQTKYFAHRISYVIFNGDFDWDLLVCHKCDNPRCVNPDHLTLGTGKDNNTDMAHKGRGYRCSMNFEQACAIRQKYKDTDYKISNDELIIWAKEELGIEVTRKTMIDVLGNKCFCDEKWAVVRRKKRRSQEEIDKARELYLQGHIVAEIERQTGIDYMSAKSIVLNKSWKDPEYQIKLDAKLRGE